MEKDIKDVFLERVKDYDNPVISKGFFSNSMATEGLDFFFWRPNNYRRQLTLKKSFNSIGKTTIVKLLKKEGLDVSIASHSGLLFVKCYYGNITIQFGKYKLTAIWSQNRIGGFKETFKVSKEDFSFVTSKVVEIEKACDKALFSFCEQFCYKVVSEVVWSRHEDFFEGESYVDSIPSEVIIHDPFFKKVYRNGVEAIGGLGVEPTERMRLYIHNRMKEDNQDFNKSMVKLLDEALLLPFDKMVEFVEKTNVLLYSS